MHRPAVSGGAVVSRVITVGQAPGTKEPVLGRPFAWTAGKTLFGWFQRACGMTEDQFRSSIYMAAVCRCFPGKTKAGGDRVPDPMEIAECSARLDAEIQLLKPELIIPIGKLAIAQFLPPAPLTELIGRTFQLERAGQAFDFIPLPHPRVRVHGTGLSQAGLCWRKPCVGSCPIRLGRRCRSYLLAARRRIRHGTYRRRRRTWFGFRRLPIKKASSFHFAPFASRPRRPEVLPRWSEVLF